MGPQRVEQADGTEGILGTARDLHGVHRVQQNLLLTPLRAP